MNTRATLLTALLAIALTAGAQLRLNQVGYYPAAPKIAVVENTPRSCSATITDAKGKTVWRGRSTKAPASPFDTQTRWQLDFSSLTTPGHYTLRAAGHKAPLTITKNALHEVVAKGMKAYYLLRTATPIEARYAGAYARPAAHPDNHVLVHPTAASPGRPAATVIASPGGWYDAGDFNKYIVNSGFSVGVLLETYLATKAYLDTLTTNIPESGHGTPDFLAEVMYNLKWMLTMQDPADGGVYHKLTTPSFEAFIMPIECKQPRYVVQKSTPAALDFAAAMALAARVYAPYAEHAQFCKEAIAAARRAWAWAVAHPAVLYEQDRNNELHEPKVTTGKYDDTSARDEFYWAATELYLATSEAGYRDVARQFEPESVTLPVWGNLATLGTLAWLNHGCTEAKGRITAFADSLVARTQSSAYRCPHGNAEADFMWGSNSEHCATEGILLLAAYRATADTRYRDAAIMCADYLLGRNATGYCYVTGFGTQRVKNPHMRLAAADGIAEPLPGFLVGGPNVGRQDAMPTLHYTSTLPDRSYIDDTNSYASNEIAINWNATLVALIAGLETE